LFISDNTWSRYNEQGDRIGFTEPGDRSKGDILSDISTSFLILIGIIFPSLTGKQWLIFLPLEKQNSNTLKIVLHYAYYL